MISFLCKKLKKWPTVLTNHEKILIHSKFFSQSTHVLTKQMSSTPILFNNELKETNFSNQTNTMPPSPPIVSEIKYETFKGSIPKLTNLCQLPATSIDQKDPHLSIFAGFLKELEEVEVPAEFMKNFHLPLQHTMTLTQLKQQSELNKTNESQCFLNLSHYSKGEYYRIPKKKEKMS